MVFRRKCSAGKKCNYSVVKELSVHKLNLLIIFSLVSPPRLEIFKEEPYYMKVSLLDVCGKVIGARSGVECIRTVFVFTHQRAILHA